MPRTALTLSDKVKLIELKETQKLSTKELITRFKCGKTQVYDAIKNKEKIMDDWVNSKNSGKSKRVKNPLFEQIDQKLYEWFNSVRSKNLPISGPILQTEAMKLAEKMNVNDFKASNGWLEKFKKRHDIVWKQVSGEANDVNQETVEEWKQKISRLIAGYEAKDVYNADETGLFFKGIPTKSLVMKSESCSGGKKAKDRLTVLMCGSMAGEIRKPLVIGKSKKPRCFKNMDISSLPVIWKFNKKAWMTTEIMEQWLRYFNADMRSQNRNVLMFLDNAACHPKIELSNMKILMLPPNTTSITQPMDQGVIYTFKSYYRKFLLQSLLCKMDNCSSAHQFAKSISVLDAVNWIALACNNVKAECVRNCFRKAGFLSNEGTNIDLPENALKEMNEECVTANVDVEDFITFDSKLETHQTYDSVTFLEDEEKEEENDDNDDSETNDEPKIKDFKTAISYLEDLQKFSAMISNSNLLELTTKARECAEHAALKHKKQSNIKNYFS
ncbi:tigger transposable element-derived protein 6-like [Metopolophium dirhodum]|uniref:tigger transposable element-derived protein 6-like n=2 Tax=Aphidinae TaxID=133076 RepID=UPI000DC140D9|nr:tigger transposable element-derived protein 6-like [Melanaphis sacchari]XP_060855025.1 tigger transposable element-derived protein 6-like [Metopolophium dirhodum]XP_060855283.1 tigger transposable element-derived protein 6-like [Metopolophium dirhodum]XP_060861817.1 tigger transposable element-derived protein 6-like [Metopolophium dirhodum]XP_060864344.1 tigger transposable element-derived protein 6-like [Metopolophium dirhodum]XP_060871401.1 tigger transposable element-derived protein 6-li